MGMSASPYGLALSNIPVVFLNFLFGKIVFTWITFAQVTEK